MDSFFLYNTFQKRKVQHTSRKKIKCYNLSSFTFIILRNNFDFNLAILIYDKIKRDSLIVFLSILIIRDPFMNFTIVFFFLFYLFYLFLRYLINSLIIVLLNSAYKAEKFNSI